MADHVLLNGAVLHESGLFFLLLDPGDGDEDESVFAVGRREGTALTFREFDDIEEFVSITTFQADGFEDALGCAMTADGKLLFSDGQRVWIEFVPDANAYEDGVRTLRRMRTVHHIDGTLYATGFAGQVYSRRAGESWRDISFESSELAGGNAIFYHVVHADDGVPIFAGIFAHNRDLTEEMKAALAASDGKLFLKLKRAKKKQDHMLVAEYRGKWTVLFADHPGVASWFAKRKEGGYYLVSSSGIVWETDNFVEMVELWRPEAPKSFDDIKMWQGDPLLFVDSQLHRLGVGGELDPFEPPLPGEALPGLSLWSTSKELMFAQSNAIWMLEDGIWVRLELIPA